MRLRFTTILTFCAIALAMTFLGAMVAHAHGGNGSSQPATVTGHATSPTPGACVASGLASKCPSGSCTCVMVPNAVVNGGLQGRLNIFATFDNGDANSFAGCVPVYSSMSGTLSKNGRSASVSIDAFLVQCAKGKVAGGGWGLTAPAVPVTGLGSLSGTFDGAHGKVALTAVGRI